MVNWRVYERNENGKETVLSLVGEFTTKAEAVSIVMARRAPKSPIYRVGRDYNYAAPDKK